MLAVGYVRRSKRSNERTVSLEEQRSRIETYCKTKNFLLVAIVTHDGVSGAKRQRFDDITGELTNHKAEALVIYHLDRLARDAGGLIEYLKSLAEKKIQIHETSSGLIKSETALDKFQTGVRGVVDEFYRNIIADKTKDALAHLRENNKRFNANAPFGYRHELIRLDDATGRAAYRLVEDKEEQRALDIIRSCRMAGFGARKTRRALESAQYLGRIGLATIHKLLHDPPETHQTG